MHFTAVNKGIYITITHKYTHFESGVDTSFQYWEALDPKLPMYYYDVALSQMGNMHFCFSSIKDSTKVNIFLLK